MGPCCRYAVMVRTGPGVGGRVGGEVGWIGRGISDFWALVLPLRRKICGLDVFGKKDLLVGWLLT